MGRNGASKWPQTASKRARNECRSTPNGPEGPLWEKRACGLFFGPPFGPKMGRLEGPCGAERCRPTVRNGAETARKRVFGHPQRSRAVAGGTPSRLRPFPDPFRGHLGRFGGQTGHTPFTGEKQAKHDQKAARTLPEWIPSRDPQWWMSRGRRAPFGVQGHHTPFPG